MKRPVVVFLYTEIAAYFTSCCEELQQQADVHVIRYPVNKEAPFRFDEQQGVRYYERKEYSFEALKLLVASLQPDIIFCSGWIDKEYLKICALYKGKIPTVLCMDTKWKGTLKQQIASLLSPFVLKTKFSHAWVPGRQQQAYAQKLGFAARKIYSGYYCADTRFFSALFEKYHLQKKKHFPKRVLYVGRYYEFKGVADLWQAFIQLQQEEPSDWELWCLGTGDLQPAAHPKIKHFGFVQPKDLEQYIANTGVFVLPSRFEPWAVVVHEYAAAGFPLLLSSEVGAADAFLSNGINGFLFEASNITDLKEKLKSITRLANESLHLMGEKSALAAQSLTTQNWAQTALKIIHDAD